LKSQVAFRSARAKRCSLSTRRPLLFRFLLYYSFVIFLLATIRTLAISSIFISVYFLFSVHFETLKWKDVLQVFGYLQLFFRFCIMFVNTKESKANNVQPGYKFKKRKFYRNRHTNEIEVFANTSAKKLKNKDDFEITIECIIRYPCMDIELYISCLFLIYWKLYWSVKNVTVANSTSFLKL